MYITGAGKMNSTKGAGTVKTAAQAQCAHRQAQEQRELVLRTYTIGDDRCRCSATHAWSPPGVCGPRPLLTLWDPRFSWAHRQPATHSWSLPECAAPGRSAQCGTHVFPGLTANPQHTLGPWSVRPLAAPRNVGPAVSWADRQPATHCC